MNLILHLFYHRYAKQARYQPNSQPLAYDSLASNTGTSSLSTGFSKALGTSNQPAPSAAGGRFGRMAQFGMGMMGGGGTGTGLGNQPVPSNLASNETKSSGLGYGRHRF
jgi:hypothetical protein